MKKRIILIFFAIFTTSMVFTGCKSNSDASKQEAVATTKVEQSSDTNTADKKDDKTVGDKKDEATKTDDALKSADTSKTDSTKSATTEEQKASAPAYTENKASTSSSSSTRATKSNPAPAQTSSPAPAAAPAPTPEKPSGIADVNDAFRIKYFKWCPSYYSGTQASKFDNITLQLAEGNISKEQAVSKIKAVGTWKEGDKTYVILEPKVTVYYTATNDAQKLINELYDNKVLTSGNNYDDTYVYYDASVHKNKVVMIGIDFITRVAAN